MKNDNTQAYIEADKKHQAIIHQAWLEYAAVRDQMNKACAAGQYESQKDFFKEICNKAANKMKAAKAARSKELNKILKAG
jgi:hypothetical protein